MRYLSFLFLLLAGVSCARVEVPPMADIPAGEFVMGTDCPSPEDADEAPARSLPEGPSDRLENAA